MLREMVPSPQQERVFDWIEYGEGSAVIEAVAGAGKTTTLLHGLSRTQGDVAFTAFSKAIASELQTKTKSWGFGSRVKSGTVHSFGRLAVMRAYPKTQLNDDKLRIIADRVITKNYYKIFAIEAARAAKKTGIGIVSSVLDPQEWYNLVSHFSLDNYLPFYAKLDEGIQYAQEILRVSNLNVAKLIDFEDMVYVPVLNNLKMSQYPWVFLDEAQDTNYVRRELIKKMLLPGGRLVAVGDTHQSIFGFTGADCESLDKIRQEFEAVSLPLTISYRCPKKVVAVANQWVKHIEPAADAEDGVVDTALITDLIHNSEFKDNDVIICRKTKPLVELAFTLIKNGIPCKVEGRSIGNGLATLAKKWKVSTVGELYEKLYDWERREIEKASLKGDNSRCDYVEDQAETLRIMMRECGTRDSLEYLVEKIKSFFRDSGKTGQTILTLSTIHKAKGREWDRVFVLDMDKHSPSKWAKKNWEMEQEKNLCYVQVTRAKKHLTFIHTPKPSR